MASQPVPLALHTWVRLPWHEIAPGLQTTGLPAPPSHASPDSQALSTKALPSLLQAASLPSWQVLLSGWQA